jgi:predicted NBD/HSP70 family sugar kinase
MKKQFSADRNLIRAINRSIVLNAVKNHGPISRTDLAQLTGLSPASISNISSALIQTGLIFEKESGDSSGGRKPVLLALDPRGGYVIGIKLTEFQVSATLTDLEATVILNRSAAMDSKDPQVILEYLSAMVQDIIASQHIPQGKLLGIGLGLAGIISTQEGVLRYSPVFGWRNLPIGQILKDKLNVPVYLDNDVNTLTITEQLFGAGRGTDNFLIVTVGRGVGLGIVVNGRIYHGFQGGAGEFGHTVCDEQGPLCDCGKHGCLETYVADPFLLQAANRILPQPAGDIEEVIRLAKQGQSDLQTIFTIAGRKLGQGIANLINVLNPQLIIISGEGVRAGDLLFDPMRSAIRTNTIEGLADDTRIQIDSWEDFAWARGAASLVLQELFKSPWEINKS